MSYLERSIPQSCFYCRYDNEDVVVLRIVKRHGGKGGYTLREELNNKELEKEYTGQFFPCDFDPFCNILFAFENSIIADQYIYGGGYLKLYTELGSVFDSKHFPIGKRGANNFIAHHIRRIEARRNNMAQPGISFAHQLGDMNTYLITDGGNQLIKIGKSKDPFGRLKQIRTSNPNAELVAFAPKDIENILHKIYKGQRISHEWFKFANRQLKEIIREYGFIVVKHEAASE